ncbi:hypothetical protein L3X38_038471 [Prunus dulcis]|uniref:PA domain-containing protein n=1 Tax=Prunus dulcis TaxID=3755 RepID=A0AAD4V6E6_PRUDU|nr:hypothetical protein L3X38_038471 [Prunus dulcis]
MHLPLSPRHLHSGLLYSALRPPCTPPPQIPKLPSDSAGFSSPTPPTPPSPPTSAPSPLHSHLAGTPPSLDTAHFVRAHFMGLGLDTRSAHYNSLLSYPLRSSLSAHFSNGSHVDIPLTEPGLSTENGVVGAYHAYSPSGSAHAKVVFANHGTDEDYRALAELGVNVSGCVVLVKRGGDLPRGEAVGKAEQNGALAVLLYTEGRDGFKKGFERGLVRSGAGGPTDPWVGRG